MAQRMRPGDPAQTRTRFRIEAIRFRLRVHMSSIGYRDVSASSLSFLRKTSRKDHDDDDPRRAAVSCARGCSLVVLILGVAGKATTGDYCKTGGFGFCP